MPVRVRASDRRRGPNRCDQTHPDFYYPVSQTIHEHLAINADGSSPFADYVAHAEDKRTAYRQAELDAFETTSAQASNGTLISTLQAQLSERSIQSRERAIRPSFRALEPVVIKHYHRLVAVCIKHIVPAIQRTRHAAGNVRIAARQTRAEQFARAVWIITEAYSRKLEEANRIDFDSMIANATRLVRNRPGIKAPTR